MIISRLYFVFFLLNFSSIKEKFEERTRMLKYKQTYKHYFVSILLYPKRDIDL